MPKPAIFRLLALLAVLGAAAPLAAEEEPAAPVRLTLKDLYGGGRRFTRPIPGWAWRPGHAELVRTTTRSTRAPSGPSGKPIRSVPRRVLEVMDPESGRVAELLDLSALDRLVPGKGTRMRGVGRAGPPTFAWHQGGKALCAVVKGDLVWVDLEAGTQRRLTETASPMRDLNIAPDGSHVAFSRDHELWVVSTEKGKPYPLTAGGSETLLNGTLDWVYPEELGHRTAAWFSPDSRHLAYLQMDQSGVPRYRVPSILPLRSPGREMFYPKAGDPNPKVRVGVVPAAGGPTVWLALEPGIEGAPPPEYVVRVTWTPDAKRVLVATLDRAQRLLRVHACDPVNGAARIVWRESDEAWISPPSQPRWVNPYTFLWQRSEGRQRWDYGVWDAANDTLRMTSASPPALDTSAVLRHAPGGRTPGLFQGTLPGELVQGVYLADPSTKRLVRAPFAADAARSTRATLDATATYALVTTSDAVTPPRTVLARVADGTLVREIGDARTKAFARLRLAVPEYGHVDAHMPTEVGRVALRWRLWKPHDFDPQKRYGLIVHTYAGPGSRILSNAWGRGPLLTTLLCDRGFLVLQADGRGTGGQGRDWMKCVQGRLGLCELEDQVAVVKRIVARGYVDPERVGIWGWSYGGTMACNALTMRGDVFKAGVAVAPVTDWRLYDTIYTERYMGLPQDNPKGYEQTSSVAHAKQMTGHLLLLHGLGDDNVHVQNTLRLVEAFLQAKVPTYEMMLYPKRGHGIGGASLDVFTRLVGWFDEHLGPGR